MTAYAQGSAECESFRARVEIRTLNNRFADLRVRMPPGLAPLEADVRRRVQAVVRRGRVELNLSVETLEGADPQVTLNRPLVETVRAAAAALAGDFGVPGKLDLATVLSLPGILHGRTPGADVEPSIRGVLERALDAALEDLDRERAREGEALRRDLTARLDRMAELVDRIREQASTVPARARDKLLERIAALAGGVELDAARVAQEVALLADKSDVTEELVRLGGHLERMRLLLTEPRDEPVGKRLDFLLQEVHRETNTVNSKSGDLEVSRLALEVKAEAERVREQVQNLE